MCQTLTRDSLLHIQKREVFYYQGLSLNDESKQHEQECLIFHRPPTGVETCREYIHLYGKARVIKMEATVPAAVCRVSCEHVCMCIKSWTYLLPQSFYFPPHPPSLFHPLSVVIYGTYGKLLWGYKGLLTSTDMQ